MDEFDPNEGINKFSMPKSILDQLYEFSGGSEDNRGFLLLFVDQTGVPSVVSQCSSAVVEMGLRKAAEGYLDECEAASRPDINPDQD